MSEEEKKPLLNVGEATPTTPSMEPPAYEEPTIPAPYAPPPSSSGPAFPYNPSTNGTPPPYSPSTQTPYPPSTQTPYSPSTQPPGPGQSLFVQCRVCQHVIHVAPGTQSRVVKCSNCREATPIAPPPPGKKYVRCPCNCLLTCSETASRVICPRDNCKRTIGVGTIDVRPISTDRMRVICGKCHRSILWPSNAAVARCPHCRGRSYLYNSWMRYRAGVCFATGAILILMAILVTGITAAITWTTNHGGIFVIWIGMFIAGIIFIIRGIFYCFMTQSRLE